MSRIVFILGAGASKDCGAPLMLEFLDVAKDLLLSGKVEDKRPDFERVFKIIGKLQAVHSKAQLDLMNLESIFTILELGKVLKRIPGIKAPEINRAIDSLKTVIAKTLEVAMKFTADSKGIPKAPAPYEEFGRLLEDLSKRTSPTQTVSVITFNYDLAADVTLTLRGLGPDYILARPSTDGVLSVPLLKLHGSLNWATEVSNKKKIHVHRLSEYFFQRRSFGGCLDANGSPLVSTQLRQLFESSTPSIKVDSQPLIVPPSWNKADYHSALSEIWAAAASHLSEAEYIFIIGYSLPETDSFFRHLYALGTVGDRPLRRIEVFNPSAKSGPVDERFQALLGPGARARYEYHEKTFAKAIPIIRDLFPAKM
jgi:hypothetical protein